jgi:nitrite reductase/ring-hydroxylating ferredoxin subunit/uncharacterized membrane protein
MLDLLKGKPLRQPLHALMVHFPVGLLGFSALLDLLSYFGEEGNVFVRGAFYSISLGLITGVLAAIPGLADYSGIREDHPAKRIGAWHLALNATALILFGISLLWRLGVPEAPSTPVLAFLFSIVAVLCLSLAGYLGGLMVYGDGIGVGRHLRRTKAPRRTRQAMASDAMEQLVTVADESELGERETIRFEARGKVMTVARLDGKVFAFQEFCTHRYGPLSEGCFQDGAVVCPWHRSAFAVETGEVTKGPAKVDLRTFEVILEDGKIKVRVPPAADASMEQTPAGPDQPVM